MGMNNHGALRVIVDIETAPIPEASAYLDLAEISAPSNWKDPEKIAAYVKEKQLEQVSKAALDLDLCQVVALGWWIEGDSKEDLTVLVCKDEAFEQSALQAFWSDLDSRVTIGYNQVGFDLPILLRRSLYLNVDAPMLNLDKYRSNHIDLQQRLSLNGTKPYRSLNWYCKRFGLDVPCDDCKGSDIGALVTAGEWDQVEAHCRADVLKTAALARRLGLLKVEPAMSEAMF